MLFDEEIGDCSQPICIRIPHGCVQERFLEIDFQFPDAVSPKALGQSEDTRELAFAITSFSLERQEP